MENKSFVFISAALTATLGMVATDACAQRTGYRGIVKVTQKNGNTTQFEEREISSIQNEGSYYNYGAIVSVNQKHESAVQLKNVENVSFDWIATDVGYIDIDYKKEISDDAIEKAIRQLDTDFATAINGIYGLRGGKEGGAPEAHRYQFQNSFGPDNYVQYFCVPHYDFPYSNATLRSTYDLCPGFASGPGAGLSSAVSYITPVLQSELINNVPELKAIYLLMYNYAAIENVDLFGPVPYYDYKGAWDTRPYHYEAVRVVYYRVKEDIDKIVDCLSYYKDHRSDFYKEEIANVMCSYLPIVNKLWDRSWDNLDVWKRFANSLKLRMAMHMSKVEPATAKQWAEEAIAGGVIESVDDELAVYPSLAGCDHPLVEIVGWSDVVMGASFVNLLQNLQHPYMKYLFTKNYLAITNSYGSINGSSAPATTPKESVYVGMRDGVAPGEGQAVANNPYCGYSTLDKRYIARMHVPMYFMKYSEVCFLRAEGALRGWNMGGTSQQFYEEGIRNAYLESRDMKDIEYKKLVGNYMNIEKPTGEKYVDPQGITPDMASVTNIGVKWNEGDNQETKLQKIITQKYIASFPYSYEPWVDLRRTGYPKLFPILNPQDGDGTILEGDHKVQSHDNIMRRIPWTYDDSTTKAELEETAIPALGLDAGTRSAANTQMQRLWWDIDCSNF